MRYFHSVGKGIVLPLFFLLFSSCSKKSTTDTTTITPPPTSSDADLKSLPKDLGGIQTAVYLSSNIDYGYFVYTPSGYNSNQADYPLLVFLHGSGEVGNSMVDHNALNKLLAHGPPGLISRKNWAPRYPMIVVSPQSLSTAFDPAVMQNFIKYLIKTYRVNIHRIYFTGLSLGALHVFQYITQYVDQSYAAAAVPMSAAYENHPLIANLVKTPIWTFSGESDHTVFIKLITTIGDLNILNPPVKAKITGFPGIGHDCWDLVYSGSGMGKEDSSYDAFNMSIYDWMFQYTK
ncbi:MAG: hypothetical protein ABIN25_12670 [Ginsengibacter sp.]